MQIADIFDVAVIGAGPAGLAIVCELLFQRPNVRIAWIDPDFHSGRLTHFPNVPSNTKIALFLKYSENVNRIIEGVMEEEAIKKIQIMDPDAHCPLALVSDMVAILVKKTIQSGKLTRAVCDTVHDVTICGKNQIDIEYGKGKLSARIAVLATGSHPSVLECSSGQVIDLEVALNPAKLCNVLKPNDTVHVYGNSHSGMLVLKNITDIGAKVVSLYRSPPKYAIYQEHSPQIIYDNTGLKGTAASWAKAHWDSLEKQNVKSVSQEILPSKIVHAVGFERNESLNLRYNEINIKLKDLTRTEGARLCYQSRIIPGLYGVGIAFPGKDVYEYNGNVIQEESVGLFKFFRHAAKDVPVMLSELDRP